MAFTYSISITDTSNNTTLPAFTPAELKIDYDSFSGSDSGRSADGTMHISWIKTNLAKLEITLPPHKYNDPKYCNILKFVQGKATLKVIYWDYLKGDTVNDKLFYCSQTSAGYTYLGYINDASFELIQMS